MGIRFLCVKCERRLNVKSFLAGKRGVCPHCGASIEIPPESQIPSRKEVAASANGGEENQQVDSRESVAAVAASASATPSPTPAPASVPIPSSATATAEPDAGGGAPPMPTGVAVGGPSDDPTPVGQAVAPIETPTGTPAPAAPPPPASVGDPISDAPHMVWYVRPPSGGQFGPARGEIMSKWIEEGRVSADSLVWREGWGEWKSAGEVLPALAQNASSSSAGFATSGGGPGQSTATAANAYRSRRRKSNQLAITSVIVLVLLSVVLLVALVIKLQGGF